MPHIALRGPALSVEAKRELVQKLTEAAAAAYQMPQERFMIHIHEFSKENIASGGLLLCDKKESA